MSWYRAYSLMTLCLQGSHNARVRLWQCGEGFRQLDPLCDIPLVSGLKWIRLSLQDSGGLWNEQFLLFPYREVSSGQGHLLSQSLAGTPSFLFLYSPSPTHSALSWLCIQAEGGGLH